jgi:uncharacterized protein YjbI with pentapeptide repeats
LARSRLPPVDGAREPSYTLKPAEGIEEVFLRRWGALSLGLALVAAATADPALARSGASIANDLRHGRSVVLYRTTVTGSTNLWKANVVRGVFECHECRFLGPVVAPDVVFARTVDLSGATFERYVDFRGATFQAPALFRAVDENEADIRRPPKSGSSKLVPATFVRRADFSLAVFSDIASFGGAKFQHEATFSDARFSDCTFSNATFGAVVFDRASFRGAALFNAAKFEGGASFDQTDFQHHTDFASTKFRQGGDFSGAQFTNGASFLAAQFVAAPDTTNGALFQAATSSGDLNFTFAAFTNSKGGTAAAVFTQLACSAALVLRDLTVPDNFLLAMNKLQVRDLRMDVDYVSKIEGRLDQITALGTIESSAKARDDLREANSAHYALQTLRSDDYNLFWRPLDYVFYRGVAGYFVRPTRPLLALVVLVALVASLRLVLRRHGHEGYEEGRRPRIWRRTGRRCGDMLACFFDTLSLVGPRWGSAAAEKLPVLQRVEVFVYRLLLVCVLLGLANSNPTLRQMVDTLI